MFRYTALMCVASWFFSGIVKEPNASSTVETDLHQFRCIHFVIVNTCTHTKFTSFSIEYLTDVSQVVATTFDNSRTKGCTRIFERFGSPDSIKFDCKT